jgi:hypothetical protein
MEDEELPCPKLFAAFAAVAALAVEIEVGTVVEIHSGVDRY